MMTKQEFETILSNLTAAKDNLHRLMLEMQTVRAKLYLDVRKYPGKYGLEKATENTIEAVTNLSVDVFELENKIIIAKHDQSFCFEKYDLAKYEIDLMKNESVNQQNLNC